MPITKPRQVEPPPPPRPERQEAPIQPKPPADSLSKMELVTVLDAGHRRVMELHADLQERMVDALGQRLAGRRRVTVHSIERDREGRITGMQMDVEALD